MKIKVYHLETDEYGRIISPSIVPHGYVEMDKFDAEYCWHLCNWFHWSEEKPDNVHSDIDTCTHGLIVYNADTKEYWLALSNGWLHGETRKISEYVKKYWEEDVWPDESEVL